MTALSVLGILAGVLAGVAVFCFRLGALHRSEWLLVAGAACLAGFVTSALSWAAMLAGAR